MQENRTVHLTNTLGSEHKSMIDSGNLWKGKEKRKFLTVSKAKVMVVFHSWVRLVKLLFNFVDRMRRKLDDHPRYLLLLVISYSGNYDVPFHYAIQIPRYNHRWKE